MPDSRHKVMVIGLDGASFNFIKPFCEKGLMSNLHNFWKQSCSGELISSYPPITPAAWTSFMTGKLPGKHQVLDFEQFSFGDNSLRYNTSIDMRASTLWSILSRAGRKSGVINVPLTYPPEKVNGLLVAGHNVPNPSSQYTYPQTFKDELLKRIPDYLTVFPKRGRIESPSVFDSFISANMRTIDHYLEATKLVNAKLDWDFLMTVFPHTDMGHHVWRYIDPEISGLTPNRTKRIGDIFKKLDEVLGQLFNLAQERGATTIVMSDHGHGTMRGWVRANKLLQKWGYLIMTNPLTWLGKRIHREHQKMWHRNKYARPQRYVDEKLGIDWSKTKAAVCHTAVWGFLYFNVRGRQPSGIIEPGKEYKAHRQDLIERFLAATDPETGEKLFTEVLKPEEVYGVSNAIWDCPDLLLVPQEGMKVNRRTRKNWIVKHLDTQKAYGTHLLKGLWMAGGPEIKSDVQMQANIHDLAPTILTLMGLKVPDDMDGKVMTGIFQREPNIRFSKTGDAGIVQKDEVVYSAEEEKQIAQRLADLGYIE